MKRYTFYTIIVLTLTLFLCADAFLSDHLLDIADETEEEKNWRLRIQALDLSAEAEALLLARKISPNTPAEHIKIALGHPLFITGYITDHRLIEVWGYHFKGDGRPTMIELKDNTLLRAYRGSYPEIEDRYGRFSMR